MEASTTAAPPTTIVMPDGAAPIADVESEVTFTVETPTVEPTLADVAPDPEQKAVFDPAPFQRSDWPEVDGVRADKIVVSFAG